MMSTLTRRLLPRMGAVLLISVVMIFGFDTAQVAAAPSAVGVQGFDDQLNAAGGEHGAQISASESNPSLLAAKIINAVFGILGIVFLGLVVYAGYQWMTAAGDAKQVEDAKSIIERAVIGLVVVLLAYAISTFVTSRLIKAAGA